MQKTKQEDTFMRADEVAKIFDCSKEYAYKIIRNLNADLEKKGFITMQGRVSRKYFQERFFG
ncbi:MAG: DNA-binding protein [Lachnospiraceae bacterium]|nr:DNA-binding protein [Lachnospiraceae bacterium]